MPPPPTIIIADPDPLISNVLRVEFSRADFVVLLANGGPEAEVFASRAAASLVMLDVALPGVSSYDACARIRRRPGYGKTPIVVTARTLKPKIEAAALTAGATAVLGKPYSFGDLLNSLAPHLLADDLLLTHRTRAPGMAEPPA